MAAAQLLPILLGIAWLIPLVSFVAILFFGPRMGAHGKGAATVATTAIGASLFLSLIALVSWTLAGHPVRSEHHDENHASIQSHDAGQSPGIWPASYRSPAHSDAVGDASGHGVKSVHQSRTPETGTHSMQVGHFGCLSAGTSTRSLF